MNILDKILAYKIEFVAAAKKVRPLEAVRESAFAAPEPRSFASAVRGTRSADGNRETQSTLRVVAEVKKASPSKGTIRADFNAGEIARSYEAGGAAALSVLTDEHFFKGGLDCLMDARKASSLPILRKEFIIDPYQVYEARATGADAILIIAGLIPNEHLAELRALAKELGLDVLLEIHNGGEIDAALALKPDVLGINNRDLRSIDFNTDISRTEELIDSIPPAQTLISESGIRNQADVARLAGIGVDGLLVGEHLMREPDPGAAIHSLLGLGHRTTLAKVNV